MSDEDGHVEVCVGDDLSCRMMLAHEGFCPCHLDSISETESVRLNWVMADIIKHCSSILPQNTANSNPATQKLNICACVTCDYTHIMSHLHCIWLYVCLNVDPSLLQHATQMWCIHRSLVYIHCHHSDRYITVSGQRNIFCSVFLLLINL